MAASSVAQKNNQPKSAKGGKREGAGRKPGVPNKATASIRDAAQAYSAEALETLAEVMRDAAAPPAARIAAANAIHDRAHGKPKQSVEMDATLQASVTEIRRTIVGGP